MRDAKGLFDLEDSIKRYNEQVDPERRQAAGRLQGPTGKPIVTPKTGDTPRPEEKTTKSNEVYLQARASKAAFAAKREELKFREEAGELINAADARKTCSELARAVRDEILRLEKRLMPHMTEDGKEHLRGEIHLAIENMHQNVKDFSGEL